MFVLYTRRRRDRRRPRQWALIVMGCLPWLGAPALACTLSTGGVVFGIYDPLSDQTVESVGDIDIYCEETASYTLSLSTGGGSSFSPRVLTSGSDSLQYNLYTDATYQVVWGDGSGSTQVISGTAEAGMTERESVYGSIPARQNVYAGDYQDTIVVTIQY